MTALRPAVVMSLRSSSVAIRRLESTPRISLISGDGHRLLVGDDGQGFKRRQRKADRRLQALGEGAHHVVLLGLGGHAVAARHLADFNAVVRRAVFGDEFLERCAHARLRRRFGGAFLFGKRGLFDQLNDLFQRDRRFGRVHNRFDLGFKTH